MKACEKSTITTEIFTLLTDQGPVSRKSRELFGPEKPFIKLRPTYSVKLVFSYVVKGIKIKITAKLRAPRHLRFEDTKRIMSPEMCPKSFGTFEKWAPALYFLESKIGHKHDEAINFDYKYQNPSGFSCLMLIRAIVIFTSLGIQNLNKKKNKLDFGTCNQMTPS